MNAITERTFDGMNATDKRVLSLLSGGCTPAQVAAATGITEARISQMLAVPEFASAVTTAKIEKLSAANTRDAAYDTLEDTLIEKLADSIPFASKPLEIARLLKTVNEAKRRGVANTEQTAATSTVVPILMPTTIIQKFTTNINNQVISAGEQVLETIQSQTLLRTTKEKLEVQHAKQIGAPEYVQSTITENLGSAPGAELQTTGHSTTSSK